MRLTNNILKNAFLKAIIYHLFGLFRDIIFKFCKFPFCRQKIWRKKAKTAGIFKPETALKIPTVRKFFLWAVYAL